MPEDIINEEEIIANEPEELSEHEEEIAHEELSEREEEIAHEELSEDNTDALKEEILFLKQQISELEAAKKEQERMLGEISDLHALFPEADLEEIPESVWESVKKGCSLPAAYALYQRRAQAEAERIAKINSKNASSSPGTAGKNTANEYFSPDEVRKMSSAEVHANYSKIKESMKKWM